MAQAGVYILPVILSRHAEPRRSTKEPGRQKCCYTKARRHVTRKQYSILFGSLAVVFVFLPLFIQSYSETSTLVAEASIFVLSPGCALVSIFVSAKEKRGKQALGMILGLFLSFFLLFMVATGGGGFRPAKRTACLSNIRQLSLVNLMYAADNDDTLPLADNWREVSEPYIKPEEDYLQQKYVKREMKCPIATTPWHYAMNTQAAGYQIENGHDELDYERVMLFEADAYLPNASGGAEWFVMRHDGFGTIGFVDGHAKFISEKSAHKLVWSFNPATKERLFCMTIVLAD